MPTKSEAAPIPRDAVFVDTSDWAAPMLHDDPRHETMRQYALQLQAQRRHIVTTDDVLGELIPLLTKASHGLPRPRLIAFINQIRAMPRVHIVHIDAARWEEGWALLERRPDKAWSHVDAASFVVMRRLGLTEAFTGDHHFEQAGFVRMPQ